MSAPEVDPTQPASPAFKRGVFVGMTASAAALVASAPAGAQVTLGHPHAPLVAQDDPAIDVEQLTLGDAAAPLPAYAAIPAHSTAATPSVVVVMHVWGVDTSIRDVVRRLAKAGYAAIAPDLYAGFGAPSGDGATDVAEFRPFAKRLEPAVYVAQIRTAAEWLHGRFAHTKTAILGFCMGGRMALIAATQTGDRFAAVCPFYGPLTDVDPAKLVIPVCGSYGARDTSIPEQSVRGFAAALHVPNDVRIYDEAGHAFFDDQRQSYVASAAADAWKRTLAFLETYLGARAS